MIKNSVIRIAGIVHDSIVDGPGFRTVIFVQGCPHHCPGCHNPQTHDFDGGEEYTVKQILNELSKNEMLHGVTFSGGEPFCQPGALSILAQKIHEMGLSVVCYTGYLFEDLLERSKKDPDIYALLRSCDVLIDGPFRIEERDLEMRFRGSRNQRYIVLPESLRRGKAVVCDI